MTDLENKVRAACADTTWGASGSDLMQIAQGTYSREDYALIMSVVWQRLGSTRWRCVYKALEVLKYLVMHGSSRCLEDARAAQHHIQTLEHYRFVDPNTHRDEGENVRTRARLVVAMIADPAILDEEREKDKALRAKLGSGTRAFGGSQGGISSADYQYGSRSGSGGGYGGQGPAVHTSYSGGGGGGGAGGAGPNRASRSSRYDDETLGGYDDEPRGAFGALSRNAAAGGAGGNASMEQSVDDLLGGGGDGGSAANDGAVGGGEDDDDDFNPRAVSSGGGGGGGGDGALDLESMLGGLDGNGTTALSAPTAANGGAGVGESSVPMSQLVQNLAAQKQAAVAQIEAPPGAQAVGLHAQAAGSPALDASFFCDPAPAKTASSSPGLDVPRNEMSSAVPVALTRKEVDPFADLLSSAKGAV